MWLNEAAQREETMEIADGVSETERERSTKKEFKKSRCSAM